MNSVRILAVAAAGLVVAFSAPALAHGRVVAAADKAELVLEVAPGSTEVYVDGQKKGTGEALKQLTLAPGPHVLRLVHDGDEHEDQVTLEAGKKVTFSWKFQDDKQATAGSDFDFISTQTAADMQ